MKQVIQINASTSPATPSCHAFDTTLALSRTDALNLCLTPSYRLCPRFNGSDIPPAKITNSPEGGATSAAAVIEVGPEQTSLLSQIFWSLFWVVTIPVVITTLIIIALFLTEWLQ